jgi:hypothetical protein
MKNYNLTFKKNTDIKELFRIPSYGLIIYDIKRGLHPPPPPPPLKFVKDMKVGEVYGGWKLIHIETTGLSFTGQGYGQEQGFNLKFEKNGAIKTISSLNWQTTEKEIIAQLSKYGGGKRRTHKHKKTRKHKKSRKSTRRHNKRR